MLVESLGPDGDFLAVPPVEADGPVGGPLDADAAVNRPVVMAAQPEQVLQVGGATVRPLPDVMGMCPPGAPATREPAGAVPGVERSSKPVRDLPGASSDSYRSAALFEEWSHMGIAEQSVDDVG